MTDTPIASPQPERYWRADMDHDSGIITLSAEPPLLKYYGGVLLLAGLAIALNLLAARLQMGLLGWLLVPTLVLAGLWLLRYRSLLLIDPGTGSEIFRQCRLFGITDYQRPLRSVDSLLVRHVRGDGTLGHLHACHVLYAIQDDQLVQWATAQRRAPLEDIAKQLGDTLACPVELETHTLQDTLLSLLFKCLAAIGLMVLLGVVATFLHLSHAIKVVLASLFFAGVFAAGLWGLTILIKRQLRRH